MKPRLLSLSLIVLALTVAACSGVTRVPPETPQLGVNTSAAPTLAATPSQATGPTQDTEETPEPTDAEPTDEPTAIPPTATVGLPEGVIILPTVARIESAQLPPQPQPVFPPGVLEATLAAAPPAAPQVVLYTAVYQPYEHGAMLHIAEMDQIFALVEAPGERGGPYYQFADEFLDGDPEEIVDLQVPAGLHQPHRGFGRIWREQPDLRNQLGWASDFERPFTLRSARVHAGGFDAAGNFLPNAGIWMMTIPDEGILFLNEATETWAIGSNQ